MRIEPPMDHAALLQRVRELYGLPALDLTFVPEGECGVSYVLHCPGGRRYFLKLWPDTRQGRILRARLDTILPVTRELHERGLFPNLPAPLITISGGLRGDFAGDFAPYELALFPYIEGRPLAGSQPAPTVLVQIARALAALHRATPLLHSPLPNRSAFELGFEDDLRRGLQTLEALGERIGPGCTPGQARLRELLLPRRDALLADMEELNRLQPLAERSARYMVLCHTDMGGNNVLIDAAGQVYILDWDDLILAPPEQDLAEYRGPGFANFLEMYALAGGISELDPQQFAFYLKRRYLGDLVDWLMRILYENNDPRQDASDLEGVVTYCLPSLDRFDTEMIEISTALAK